MNFYDFIIIYLACGAPFGVFFYVNHRRAESRVLIQAFLVTIFWIPFAFKLLQNLFSKKLPHQILSKEETLKDERINTARKNLEMLLTGSRFEISVFELREVIDRYVGLTVALENPADTAQSGFFEIPGNENSEPAAKCLQRRNRKLLSFHQTLAGQDFLKLISEFVSRFPGEEKIEVLSIDLVKILDDEKTEKKLRMLFIGRKQSADSCRVPNSEKDLWITDRQIQPSVKALKVSMNRTAAKISLSIKD